MAAQNVCIGVFPSLATANQAFDPLRATGFDLQHVSLVGKDHPDKQIHGYHTTGEQMRLGWTRRDVGRRNDGCLGRRECCLSPVSVRS